MVGEGVGFGAPGVAGLIGSLIVCLSKVVLFETTSFMTLHSRCQGDAALCKFLSHVLIG